MCFIFWSRVTNLVIAFVLLLLVLIFQFDNGWQEKIHLNIRTLWPYQELNCGHEYTIEIFKYLKS